MPENCKMTLPALLSSRTPRGFARSWHKVITKDDHIADLDAVFVDRLAIIPEIVLAYMVHPEATLLVEGDLTYTCICGADEQLLLATAARLFHEKCDHLLAETLALALRLDCQFHDLARLVAPTHRRGAKQPRATIHAIDGVDKVGETPTKRGFGLFR